MRRLSLALGLLAACAATGAAAETVNLTGTYRCIQMCRNGMLGTPAFVTQNRDAVNLTTETGESYRAWPDWSAPDSRIWIDARNEGAVYSPDGMRIQFDDGRVWQRDLGPPPVVVRRAHHLRCEPSVRTLREFGYWQGTYSQLAASVARRSPSAAKFSFVVIFGSRRGEVEGSALLPRTDIITRLATADSHLAAC